MLARVIARFQLSIADDRESISFCKIGTGIGFILSFSEEKENIIWQLLELPRALSTYTSEFITILLKVCELERRLSRNNKLRENKYKKRK